MVGWNTSWIKQKEEVLSLTNKNIPQVPMTSGTSWQTCSLVLRALAVFCSESVTGCDLADKESFNKENNTKYNTEPR